MLKNFEEKVSQLPNFENSEEFSEREKSALRYAALFKRGEEAIDSDQVYDEKLVNSRRGD